MGYIRTIPVESSNITAIGYDRRTGTLRVIFHRSGAYDYPNVPPNLVLDLLFAESHGEFFNRQIKSNFEYRRPGPQELLPASQPSLITNEEGPPAANADGMVPHPPDGHLE